MVLGALCSDGKKILFYFFKFDKKLKLVLYYKVWNTKFCPAERNIPWQQTRGSNMGLLSEVCWNNITNILLWSKPPDSLQVKAQMKKRQKKPCANEGLLNDVISREWKASQSEFLHFFQKKILFYIKGGKDI